MTDTDPLLRAVADGDPACPDGRALARLGELVRAHARPPARVDVAHGVRARLAGDVASVDDAASSAEDIERAEIDRAYDGDGSSDDQLARLGALVRRGGDLPRPVDLADRVRARLRQSAKMPTMPTLDGGSRWRIWSAVIASHVAALVVVALSQIAGHDDGDAGASAEWMATAVTSASTTHAVGDPAAPSLPTRLPAQWSEIRDLGSDLFMLRRFPELRDEARRHYGMQRSHDVVAHGLAWLVANQTAIGTFGSTGGDADRSLATQSLAVLALLGEGLGDQPRISAIRSGLGWIGTQLDAPLADHGQVPVGLACLAQVEGALLLADPALRAQAEESLARLERGVPVQPGAAGLGGFTLLALETAQQGGMRVPPRLLEQARRNLGRSLPASEDDAGRLGLAAFARLIYGYRGKNSTSRQLELLGALPPQANAAGQINPLGWFFATLALREAGGGDWDLWAANLQAALVPAFVADDDRTAHVPAERVHYAGGEAGDVFATSLAILNLQAAYRYLPLAGAR